jgi:hypothetical protein
MSSIIAGRMIPGSIPAAIPPDCAAASRIAPSSGVITQIEGIEASLTVRGVLAVAPEALLLEVAVVFGSEIIAERRQFFTAILKVGSHVHEDTENEDEGANDQQEKRKVGHNVLLCIE